MTRTRSWDAPSPADLERQDLELMKEANLNSLRTSHYPPLPELLDIADELGIYVEDEGSFCWVAAGSGGRSAPHPAHHAVECGVAGQRPQSSQRLYVVAVQRKRLWLRVSSAATNGCAGPTPPGPTAAATIAARSNCWPGTIPSPSQASPKWRK